MNQDMDKESLQIVAAEYVIGTLDASERADVAARAIYDKDLQQAIVKWQNHFASLNEQVAEQTPRADLLKDILAKLESERRLDSPQQAQQTAQQEQKVSLQDELLRLRQQVSKWRRMSFSAVALAACLVLVIFLQPMSQQPLQNSPLVAVFQQDDQQPAFIMSLDLTSRQLTVRAVTAKDPQGKTYQLWIKADEIGQNPRSLGVLGSVSVPIQKQLDFDADVIRHATFGISVEPLGGSPTGLPTGPAIHGTLYPTEL